MKYFIFFFLSILTISCGKPDSGLASLRYDKIEHYHLDISDDAAIDLAKSKSRQDVELHKIVTAYLPSGLHDHSSIELLKAKYRLTKIPAALNPAFSSCFHYETVDNDFASAACIPFYRDIFILYKDQKISGIIKICFGCGQQYWIGIEDYTQDHYIETDFGRLEKMFPARI